MMYRLVLRPLLFLLPSETAHHVAMRSLSLLVHLPFGKRIISFLFGYRNAALEREVLGLKFPNPLGIAAGFDKNGTYLDALSALGFGHIEVGSVTPRPQSGNPKPRLFRLKKSQALINRMGFNNDGCLAVAHRLAKYRNRRFILGANIGKNKDTPNARAVDDYLLCFDTLHPYVDYFTINVSSPNTPGLRELQDREPLKLILEALLARNREIPNPKPLLLKIAPDLTPSQVQDIVSLAGELRLDGLVISNTTLSREGLKEDTEYLTSIGAGGLSGAPLRPLAQNLLRDVRTVLPDTCILVGVGGIDSAGSARARMESGAALIQIYTGFIYKGPGLIRSILKALA